MYSFDLKVYFTDDSKSSLTGIGGVNLERILALYVEYNVLCDEESTVTSALFENLIKENTSFYSYDPPQPLGYAKILSLTLYNDRQQFYLQLDLKQDVNRLSKWSFY